MVYDDEDSYDLTFKSYDELVDKFKEQNSLPMDVILEAIENTNVMSDTIEDVVLDATVKYPKLSDDDESLFENIVLKKYEEKINKGIINKDSKYLIQIQEEIRVFKKLNMCSFMLFMSEICIWCKENGIPTGFCRGSVGGSMIAYLLDIIDLDPIQWNTIFSRFCNEDREEVGDIDLDFSPTQRELVYNYIIDRFGADKSAYILAIGTISDKGTIDDLGRAMEYPLDEVAQIKKLYEEDSEKARKQYKDLFYYFDGVLGTSVSQSMHPAGIIASPVTLPDNYGCFWNKEGKRILYINMEEVHDGAGLVKYDILGLKNIEIIKDTCKLLNISYPASHEVNWEDEKVWEHITDSSVGIFQFEGKLK
jgi:DNA polymerase-3 subunit alpha